MVDWHPTTNLPTPFGQTILYQRGPEVEAICPLNLAPDVVVGATLPKPSQSQWDRPSYSMAKIKKPIINVLERIFKSSTQASLAEVGAQYL